MHTATTVLQRHSAGMSKAQQWHKQIRFLYKRIEDDEDVKGSLGEVDEEVEDNMGETETQRKSVGL